MAYQMAVWHKIGNAFPEDTEKAGNERTRNLLKKNSQLTIHTPQVLSFTQAQGISLQRQFQLFNISELEMIIQIIKL
jgi:hypothetical protein